MARAIRLIHVLTLAGAISFAAGAAHAASVLGPGQSAPPMQAVTLDGRPFDLTGLRGKVVVVNLWASWCPPCRVEMPALEAVYRRYRGQGMEMIALSADQPRDLAEVKRALSKVTYPAALLARARVNGFGAPKALPVTYVIDSEGTVRAVFGAGGQPLDEASLAAAVSPLLGD